MLGCSACKSTMSWRIAGGSEFRVALAPPCSPEENRLGIPYFSNASALRDRVRWGTSISLARSPAVWWKRTRGRICSYSSCSGPQRPLLDTCPPIAAHSALSLRSRHLPLPFPDNDACFKRPESLPGLQEFGATY